MDMVLQDLRYGVRSLLRSRGLTLVAVATLALGIGANTALFSLLNGIYWTPPAGVQDADGLVWLGSVMPDRSRPGGFSYPDYLDYRDESKAFSELAGFEEISVSVGTAEEPQRLRGELVTGNFFSVLRAKPALGRSFLPEEDRTPGTHPVAMISHRLWQKQFAGDPGILGKQLVVNGKPAPDPRREQGHSNLLNSVWPDFFRTLGLSLQRGREFLPSDRAGAEPVVIVNDAAAEFLWPDEDALGKRVQVGADSTDWLTVVGVVNVGPQEILGGRPQPAFYLSALQRPWPGWSTTLLIRAHGDASALADPLRERIRALDSDLPVFDVATLAETIRQNHAGSRIGSTMLTIFGALALGLAVIGLYGVVSYAATQRTREIGIRVALGAARPAILGLFARDALRMALIGIAAGSALALASAQVLRSVIRGLDPLDVGIFAAVALLLSSVTLLAAYLPARRAARVDPMVALRSE